MGANCEDIKQDLSAHFDHELESSRAQVVEAHLSACPECRTEFEKLKGLSKLWADSRDSDNMPMPDIWAAVADKVAADDHAGAEDLSALIDDELPPAVAEGVREHLAECAQCNKQYSQLKVADGLIHKALALPESVQVNLWADIRSRLNEDCALIQSELSAFLDQEIATVRHRNVVTHLMECPSCKGLFDQLSEVGSLISASYKPEIPADFDLWPEIKAKLQVVPFTARPKQQAKVIPLNRKIYAIASVVLLIGLLAAFIARPQANYQTVSAEAYMIDSAFDNLGDDSDQVVYDN